jgi:hypothetical protein
MAASASEKIAALGQQRLAARASERVSEAVA